MITAMTLNEAVGELLTLCHVLPLQVLLVCLRNKDCFGILNLLENNNVGCRRTRRKLQLFLSDLTTSDRRDVLHHIGEHFGRLLTVNDDSSNVNTTVRSNKDNPAAFSDPTTVQALAHSTECTADGAANRTLAGTFLPFSQTPIWETQQRYYKTASLSAWGSNTVPFQISSNRYVAQYYLACIHAALGDNRTGSGNTKDSSSSISNNSDISHKWRAQQRKQRKRRICLLEVASGHGRLAYLCAKAIHDQQQQQHQQYSHRPCGNSSNNGDMESFYRDNEFIVVGSDMHDGVFREFLECPWVR